MKREKLGFSDLQEIIITQDVYLWYDNDYWEINKYPIDMELTNEQNEECIIACCGGYEENVDLSTFPKEECMYPNCYGNGLLVLLAHTPNHRVKGIEIA